MSSDMSLLSSPEHLQPESTHVVLPRPLEGASGYEIVFLGDMAFGESYEASRSRRNLEPVLAGRSYSSFFDGVRHLVAGADYAIANLETPLTAIATSPLQGRKRYVHKGDAAQSIEALREIGVRAVSLANNHALDYGAQGLRDTLHDLAKGKILAVGARSSVAEPMLPLIIEMGSESAQVRLAVVAAHDERASRSAPVPDDAGGLINRVREDTVVDQIRDLRRADSDLQIVAFLHWGNNYDAVTDRQRRVARKLTEAGANLIIGHGAHTIQDIERIGSTWVVYSIGNFIFNSPGRFALNDSDPFGFVARLRVRPDRSTPLSLRLYPILIDNRQTNYRSCQVSPRTIPAIAAKCGVDRRSDVRVRASLGFIELRTANSKRLMTGFESGARAEA